MYVVLLKKNPIYIGNNPDSAIDKFNDNEGSEILKIENIDDIKKIINKPLTGEQYFSNKTKDLLEKLDKLENLDNKLEKREKKVQVKHLGPKKVIKSGEGFIDIEKEINKNSAEEGKT